MTSREEPGAMLGDALDAYRAAAWAEADSHFDDRALEAQRLRILARLEQTGTRARVLPFPTLTAPPRPGGLSSHRRWISAAAAAGLLIGLVTGQLLHIVPGDNWVHREPGRLGPPPQGRMTMVPAVATTSLDDDALLDAVDAAVARQGATDLRALDDLTFGHER